MDTQHFQVRTLAVAISTVLLAACAQDVSKEDAGRATEGFAIQDTNKLLVVDCLLPGQVRKLGSEMTFLTQRRPVRTPAADCEVRGGEYVAYDRANYASALKIWLPKAQEGDAAAQLYVGEIFEKGLGAQSDYHAAAQWYEKSAKQGNFQAQLNLGHLYEQGLGVSQSQETALRWYRKSAGLDDTGLQFTPAVNAQAINNTELTKLKEEVTQSHQQAEQLRQQLQANREQAMQQQDDLRRSQDELETLRNKLQQQKVISPSASGEITQLEQQLRDKETLLKNQQAKLDAMTLALSNNDSTALWEEVAQSHQESETLRGQLDAARAQAQKQQDELEGLRTKLQQQKFVAPSAFSEADSLERLLRKKESQLKKQQVKLNALTKTLAQESQRVKRQQPMTKQEPLAEGTSKNPDNELASQLNVLMDSYQKQSAELSSWLTSGQNVERSRIDSRKQELQLSALKIASLKEKIDQQASTQLAASDGPDIELLEPTTTVTRGIPSIQFDPGETSKHLSGRVNSRTGLSKLLLNDSPLAFDASGQFQSNLTLPGKEALIHIVAIDKHKRSKDLNLRLLASENAVQENFPSTNIGDNQRFGDIQFGKFYALIIGNNHYASYAQLKTPISDAKSLEVLLRERYGFKTKLLLNANRHVMMSALNEMSQKLGDQDNLLIYYAGHGEIDTKTQSAYWLPVDAEVGNTANWISSQSITEYLSIMSAKHIMVVADSCYSGALTGSAVAKLPDGMDASKRERWLKAMNSRKARTVLTSGGVKPVMDQGGGQHSIFAKAFLNVLRSNKRIIEDYDIFRDVSNQVQVSASRAGFEQSPQYAPLQHAGHEGSPFFFVPEV